MSQAPVVHGRLQTGLNRGRNRHRIVTILPTPVSSLPVSEKEISVDGRRRPNLRSNRITCLARAKQFLLPGFLGLNGLLAAGAEPRGQPATPSELFNTTNIWSVHLKFTPDQWEAMEPKGGPGGFFSGRGAPRGGGPGGAGGFGPAMFVAPVFLKQGDQNQDGKLSRDEFQSLAEKWFGEWDKVKSGKLDADQLRAGLNSSLAQPNLGPPGAGPPRGPGLNLQGAKGKRNGLASAAGIEFEYVRADLEWDNLVLNDVAVRYKGNGTFMQSRGSLKRSLKIDLNKFAKGRKLAGVSKLNLHNNVTDASWMNEVLSHRLFRDAGVPASRTAYARVYVSVGGKYDRQYLGLYSLVEDVDGNFAEDRFGAKKGAIFKPVTPNLFADLGDDWKSYNQTYDPKTELTPAQKQRVIDFCRLVARADEAEFAGRLEGYLELEEFARFMAVTVWLSTMDSILGPGQNYYIYLHPETRKFQFMPWDLDHSFGQFGMMGSGDQREHLSIHRPWRGENRFLERVFKIDAFKKLYLAKLDEFSKTIFKPDRFRQQVEEIAAAIRPAVKEESDEKLARFDKVVAGEPVSPAGFGGALEGPRPGGEGAGGPRPGPGDGGEGPRFGSPAGFFQPAKPIKGFVNARAQSVADQLSGKSEGETIGDFGFGGPGGRGGRGGPGGFGPGMVLGNAFMAALDVNQDGTISREEFTQGFAKWFEAWNTDRSGLLTDEQLRAGISRDLSPFRGGPPGGAPGFGRPGGPAPREQ